MYLIKKPLGAKIQVDLTEATVIDSSLGWKSVRLIHVQSTPTLPLAVVCSIYDLRSIVEWAEKESHVPWNPAARLDEDRSAKPLTRIVHHPDVRHCIGPGSTLVDPEYETETGERIPLTKKD